MSEERRKDARLVLTLPVQVHGQEPGGDAWEEMSSARDVSLGGAALMIRHSVVKGQILFLSLPLPKRFRRYDVAEPSYRVYSLVRSLEAGGPLRRTGVMFLGKQAPRGYSNGSGSLYRLPRDAASGSAPAAAERRQGRRHDIFVNFRVRRLAWPGDGRSEEQTVAENISRGGARVLTSLGVAAGDVVLLEEMGGSYQTRAEVRHTYVGQDRIPRLNLRFLDSAPPDRLVPPETAA